MDQLKRRERDQAKEGGKNMAELTKESHGERMDRAAHQDLGHGGRHFPGPKTVLP
jgi:hypothetical protein